MKKITIIFLLTSFTVLFFTFTSCDSYLETPPVASFNEDSVFTRRINVEKLVSTMYTFNLAKLPCSSQRMFYSFLDCASDIGCSNYLNAGYGAHRYNKGTITAEEISNNQNGEDVFSFHYKAIRYALLLIDRVDEVPDGTPEWKNRIKADAKTILAMQYFELMKRYGGVPLVKTRFSNPADAATKRSTLSETYNYIMQLCDEAIANPDYPMTISDPNELGRTSKVFALGLKSKAKLWIASPLFNNVSPYKDNLGGNSNLIWNGSYNKELWKEAAVATKEAIDICEANGLKLTNIGNNDLNYTAAYLYYPSKGNTELLMVNLGMANNSSPTNPSASFQFWTPRGTPINGWGTNMPTQNFVDMFQKMDGSFYQWETDTISPVNDPTYPYKNLDPRFKQIVCYNGMTFYTGVNMEMYEGYTDPITKIKTIADGKNSKSGCKAQFAYFNRKYIVGYEDNGISPKVWRPLSIVLRLTELYLNYAEALNEYYGPTTEVYNRINAIRSRSGMIGLPTGIITTEEMRLWIQRERAIELCFEDSRFFDLKRWKLGETFKGPIYDLNIRITADRRFIYKKYKYEDRYWSDHWYLHPFPPSEVNKLYGLIQNPGW